MKSSSSQRAKWIANAGKSHKINSAHSDTLRAMSEMSAEGDDRVATSAVRGQKILDQFPWWREHEELIERVKSWNMTAQCWKLAAYILWASSPIKGRKPETIEALADTLGVSTRQLRRWYGEEYDPEGLIKAEIAEKQASPILKHRRDIYEAMIESATQPNEKGFQDRKLSLEMLGDYKPKNSLDVGGWLGKMEIDYSKLTTEQLERIADGEDVLKVILDGYVASVGASQG